MTGGSGYSGILVVVVVKGFVVNQVEVREPSSVEVVLVVEGGRNVGVIMEDERKMVVAVVVLRRGKTVSGLPFEK